MGEIKEKELETRYLLTFSFTKGLGYFPELKGIWEPLGRRCGKSMPKGDAGEALV